MEGADLTSPTPMAIHDVSRPTLGFPLGTALLLIIIFCLSGIFSCCYHWDKLRSLRRPRPRRNTTTHLPTTATASTATMNHHHQHSNPPSPSKLTSKHQDAEQEAEERLAVIMPGDQVPKFMACPCPCPCQPSLPNAKIIEVGMVFLPSIQSFSAPPVNVNNY